jgi:hypothetical protein
MLVKPSAYVDGVEPAVAMAVTVWKPPWRWDSSAVTAPDAASSAATQLRIDPTHCW